MGKRESNQACTARSPSMATKTPSSRMAAGQKLAIARFAMERLAPELRARGAHHSATPKQPAYWELVRNGVLLMLTENALLLPTDESTSDLLDGWPLDKAGVAGHKMLSVSWQPARPWLPPRIARLVRGEWMDGLGFPSSLHRDSRNAALLHTPIAEQPIRRSPPSVEAITGGFCPEVLGPSGVGKSALIQPLLQCVPKNASMKGLVEQCFSLLSASSRPTRSRSKPKRLLRQGPEIRPEVWADTERLAKVDYMAAVRAVCE